MRGRHVRWACGDVRDVPRRLRRVHVRRRRVRAGDAAGAKAHLYDLASTTAKADGKYKNPRILAAILPQDGKMWFIKMTGEDSVVAREKNNFLGFVKTFSFNAAPPTGAPTVASKTGWKSPEGWREVAAGPMLKAKYLAGDAEITVSTAGGDLASNVNRWRGQFGLAQATEAEIEQAVASAAAGPLRHQLVFGDIRRAVARRFPYAVYFRIRSSSLLSSQYSTVVEIRRSGKDGYDSEWHGRAKTITIHEYVRPPAPPIYALLRMLQPRRADDLLPL